MGSFLGHAANGSFFFGYALIWMVYHAYFQARTSCSRHLPASQFKRPRRLPIIGTSFMLVCSIGLIIGENVHPVVKWRIVDESGNWTPYSREWQHCTMAMFFALYFIVNLFRHTCMPSASRYEMLFGALAFFVEGSVFTCHIVLPERVNPMERHTHVLLLLPVFGCFFSSLGEAFTKNHLLKLSYIRIVCILQQGTWMWQIAYVLFKSHWDHEVIDRMYVTVFFSWHLLINIVLLIVVYQVTFWVVRRCRPRTSGNGASESSSKKLWDDEIGMDMMEETQPCLQE